MMVGDHMNLDIDMVMLPGTTWFPLNTWIHLVNILMVLVHPPASFTFHAPSS